MRYKLDSNGYFTAVFFGCNGLNCAEYNGVIPEGFLDNIKAYKLINGVIVYDEERAQKCAGQCAIECEEYHLTTKREVLDLLNSIFYSLSIDSEGNIYAQIEADNENTKLEYDANTGDLFAFQYI